jgi:ABC-type transport system involved in multi-copper enzyme maturation permease subunit
MTAFIYLSIICSVFVTVALLLKRLAFKNKLKKIKPKILKIILGTLLAISVFIIIGLIFLVFIKQPENHTIIGLILVVNIILLFSIILKTKKHVKLPQKTSRSCLSLFKRSQMLTFVKGINCTYYTCRGVLKKILTTEITQNRKNSVEYKKEIMS